MAAYYCSLTDLYSRLSQTAVNLRIDDDASSIGPCQQEATNDIQAFCLPDYNANDLLSNANAAGWVNDRAIDLAAYYLCARRGNPVPASVEKRYERAMEMLRMVMDDQMYIPGIQRRHTDVPAWSNVRVWPSYEYKKIRVEMQTSEPTSPTGYSQFVDWPSLFAFEF